MKPTTLALIILMQVGFIAYGLALTFWTINEWLADEKLNAVFGGFVGGLFFIIAWRLLRRWVIAYFRLDNRR